MSAVLRSLFHAYASALRKHPWRTQALSTGVLWAAGDALAQKLEARASGHPYSLRRSALVAGYGAACVGPVGHAWYLGLDRVALALARPGSLAFVAGKVLADTLVFGPLHIAGFLSFMVLSEGGGWADVRAKLAADAMAAYLAECTIWPVIQAANFRLVPVAYQLLVVNAVTVLDSAFISYAGNNDLSAALVGAVPALGGLLGKPAAAAGAAEGAGPRRLQAQGAHGCTSTSSGSGHGKGNS